MVGAATPDFRVGSTRIRLPIIEFQLPIATDPICMVHGLPRFSISKRRRTRLPFNEKAFVIIGYFASKSLSL
jgi:hypothetical protein